MTAAALLAAALTLSPMPGWEIRDTELSFADLSGRLEEAVTANKMGVVSKASASANVKAKLNEDIPGNLVLGVFRPDYAKRLLAINIQAGIEAPIRFYVTDDGDGTATLSWKTPSSVLAPYGADGELQALARELDGVFAKIGADALAAKP